jgi:hypothetical protein
MYFNRQLPLESVTGSPAVRERPLAAPSSLEARALFGRLPRTCSHAVATGDGTLSHGLPVEGEGDALQQRVRKVGADGEDDDGEVGHLEPLTPVVAWKRLPTVEDGRERNNARTCLYLHASPQPVMIFCA